MKRRLTYLLLAAGGTLLVIAVGLVGFAYSGLYNVAADREDGRFKKWFLRTTQRASIESRVDDLEIPELSGFEKVMRGATTYQRECASCHGTPGREPRQFARRMNPPAPWLCNQSEMPTDAELRRWFWTIKHGVEMTGMPAWGEKDDDEIWSIVAAVRQCIERNQRQGGGTGGESADASKSASPDEPPASAGED